MGSMGEFAGRVRGYFTEASRNIGRVLRRTSRKVAITVEERPDLGALEVEVPYPLPTREDPLAFTLFYFSVLTVVVTLTAVPLTLLAYGYAPPAMVVAVGTMALILGFVANLHILGAHLRKNSTQLLEPLVEAGMPTLRSVHYWMNVPTVVLVVMFVLIHPSNNWLMHTAALVLCAWLLTGLLLKLPKDSPWNGPMLERWAGTVHRRPFVYIVVIVLVLVSLIADLFS